MNTKDHRLDETEDKLTWKQTFQMILVVGIVYLVLGLLLALALLVIYWFSLSVEVAISVNKWFTFVFTLGSIITVLTIMDRRANRRRILRDGKIKDDPAVTVEIFDLIKRSRNAEHFIPIVNFLERYDYEVEFGLFEDEVDALGLRDKCKQLSSETWAARKTSIKEHLPAIWEQQYDDREIHFKIFLSGQHHSLYYNNYLDAAEQLSAINDADIVLANLEVPESLEMIYKPATAFPVQLFVQIVSENLATGTSHENPLKPYVKL